MAKYYYGIVCILISTLFVFSSCGEISNNKKKEALNLSEKGLTYCQTGNYNEAIECFNEAIDIWPEKSMFHYYLGLAYAGEGNIAESNASYEKAIELNPKYTEAYQGLGDNHTKLKNYDIAKMYYKQAQKIGDNNSEL